MVTKTEALDIFEQVRPKLLTVDQARERLSVTEPVGEVLFPTTGKSAEVAKFHLTAAWNTGLANAAGTDVVGVTVTIGGQEYQLTRDAMLEATSYIGLTKAYVSKTPAQLIEPNVNWWYQNRPGELKALVSGDRVLAFTRPTIHPFSNLRLLDTALEGIAGVYGAGEVLVDYKFQHDLRQTAVRLIVPAHVRRPREEQPWSAGVQFRNSLSGEKPLTLEGYLFCWWCTNGAVSTHAQSGAWNRRSGGQDDESVTEWARHAVDEILGGLEHEFDALDELANTPIPFVTEDGVPDAGAALVDVFEQYRVPLESREAIIEQMVNQDDMTMYGVMQAVTQAANGDVRENVRQSLMEIGGDLPRANATRCATCRRITG